jgi:biopolymer transport protein TolR
MTMNSANASGMSSAINVTPMIDVLLVLLIIFMVIVPAIPKGEQALLPKASHRGGPDGDAVVLEVLNAHGADPAYRINQSKVSRQQLPSRLAAIFANRAERVLFVKGDDEVSFTEVAEAIDIGHAAGVDRIGLMTHGAQAGR